MGFLAVGFSVFYLSYLLLLDDTPYTGFYLSKEKFVYDDKNKISRPVNTFDIFRYYIFNPYTIGPTGELWVVDDKKKAVWSCPVCLSWWVASLFSLPYLVYSLVNGQFTPIECLMYALLLQLSSSGVSVVLHQHIEKGEENGVRLQEKETN